LNPIVLVRRLSSLFVVELVVKIVRHDSDVLLLQSSLAAKRRTPALLIVAAVTLAVGAGAAWLAVKSEWWPRAGIWSALAIVAALETGIGLLGYLICEGLLSECGLAFDRHAREILLVRKNLRRTTREVLDFDRVSRVAVDKVSTKNGTYHVASLQLTDGRKISVTQQTLGQISESDVFEIAAAMRETLGFPEPEPEVKPDEDTWAARIMGLVMGCALIGLGIFLSSTTSELWQARSWPQIEGVVESAELLKKMTTGKHPHLADTIDIVYRYQLGDTLYFGRRFKTSSNWLTPEEVPLVRQKYTPGNPCLVTYNPSNPARCFLQGDAGFSTVIATGLTALLMGLIGLVVVAFVLWRIARPKSAKPEHVADAGVRLAELTVPA
jgi:hypothetical protein